MRDARPGSLPYVRSPAPRPHVRTAAGSSRLCATHRSARSVVPHRNVKCPIEDPQLILATACIVPHLRLFSDRGSQVPNLLFHNTGRPFSGTLDHVKNDLCASSTQSREQVIDLIATKPSTADGHHRYNDRPPVPSEAAAEQAGGTLPANHALELLHSFVLVGMLGRWPADPLPTRRLIGARAVRPGRCSAAAVRGNFR